MTTAAETFKQELQVYDTNKAEWLNARAGKYVLIKGTEVFGFFDSLDEAVQSGFKKFGPVPFFTKQITKEDQIQGTPALVAGLLFVNI